MSSSDTPLQNAAESASLSAVSDVPDLRDAGEGVETTSAPPAGCRSDEAEPKTSDQTSVEVAAADPAGCLIGDSGKPGPTEAVSDGFSSVSAQGGPSDNPPEQGQTPADSIGSLRDFEAFLRSSGFSRADARAIAKSGWPSSGDLETDGDDLDHDDLRQLIGGIRGRLGKGN